MPKFLRMTKTLNMSGEENQVEGNELAIARAELKILKQQIDLMWNCIDRNMDPDEISDTEEVANYLYGLIDDAYNALEENSEQKNWIDDNWKELTKSWAEHMLDPANLGDE
tara:strand:- start:194 stop:526 length:333 start_codon:yes stop_codon:yes gene_type:complete